MSVLQQRSDIYDYNDIIQQLYSLSKNHKFVQKSIASRYPCVIIDEFQDTDTLQYKIFHNIFIQNKCTVFFFGDPKQSIYRFRNADIFTYLKVKKQLPIKNQFKLNKNWRAIEELNTGINKIFKKKSPFVFEDIEYFPSQLPIEKNLDGLIIKKEKQPALQFFHWIAEQTNTEIEEYIAAHTATEIASLLHNSFHKHAYIKGNSVQPSDIAVLVKTNEQGDLIKKKLLQYNISIYNHETQSITQTQEFWEVYLLLAGIIYNNKRQKNTALLHTIFYNPSQQIPSQQDKYIDIIAEETQYYHALLKKTSLSEMLYEFLNKKNIFSILIRKGLYQSIINIQHTIFFLQTHIYKKKITYEEILPFVENLLTQEQLLRENIIYRDVANVVQVITIHKSKGLEFPIVYCPFLWKPQKIDHFYHSITPVQEEISLHYDFKNNHNKQKEKETRSEEIRLMYVALTRAIFYCRVYLPNLFKEPSQQKITPFIDYFSDNHHENSLDILKINLPKKNENDIKTHSFLPSKPFQLEQWKLTRSFFSKYRFHSFTSLHKQIPFSEETEYFQNNLAETITDKKKITPPKVNIKTIYNLPKGIATGVFFHKILEKWHPKKHTIQELEQNIDQNLQYVSFEHTWAAIIKKNILTTFQIPFQNGETSFTLNDIDVNSIIYETEFFFLLKNFSALLQKYFQKKYPHIIKKIYSLLINHKSTHQFLKGVIDMIFSFQGKYYIIDWKTNYLGNTEKCYAQDKLHKNIVQEKYFLQAFIYNIALFQYLSYKYGEVKAKEKYGATFYVYLRGIESDSFGIYSIKNYFL